MFGRRPPSNPLKQRVRKLGERAPAPAASVAKPQRAPRQATFRNGTITYSDNYRLAVAIKDLSETGARIEFFQRIDLPDQVVLSEPMLNLRRAAKVIWRGDGVAGLKFI
jgi:hypothetical protein